MRLSARLAAFVNFSVIVRAPALTAFAFALATVRAPLFALARERAVGGQRDLELQAAAQGRAELRLRRGRGERAGGVDRAVRVDRDRSGPSRALRLLGLFGRSAGTSAGPKSGSIAPAMTSGAVSDAPSVVQPFSNAGDVRDVDAVTLVPGDLRCRRARSVGCEKRLPFAPL